MIGESDHLPHGGVPEASHVSSFGERLGLWLRGVLPWANRSLLAAVPGTRAGMLDRL